MRSRYQRSARVTSLPSRLFTQTDFDVCKLLCGTLPIRHPWGYAYLPTKHFPFLLDRSLSVLKEQLRELWDYGYLERPPQPEHPTRELIYALGSRGVDELKLEGFKLPTARSKALAHELLACLIAASFDYGALKHELAIDFPFEGELDVRPDWRIFRLLGHLIFIEADTGSETLHTHIDATSISGKYIQYLELLRDKRFKKALIIFVTTKESRMLSMIEVLKKVIDTQKADRELATQFLFAYLPYDRFLNKIPTLTDWAIAQDWKRAGNIPPFNFLKGEKQ